VLPGSNTATVPINPIQDGVSDNAETVTLYLFSAGSTTPYDSATLIILDSLDAVASEDTTICVGQSVQLTVNGATSWVWAPSAGLSCTNCQNPLATPVSTTTYTVTIFVGSCSASEQVTITIDNPVPVNAGPDMEMCTGQSVQLNAINGNTYSWSPTTGLSNPNIANPLASPTVTTTYYVTATNGCYTTTDTITVVVHPLPVITVSPDVTVCPGDSVDLFASGGVEYNWSPPGGVDDPNVADPTATVGQTTVFTVYVTNQFGCLDSSTVTVNVYDLPDIIVSVDTVIYLGNSYQMSATGGVSYSWEPPTGLNAANIAEPLATPTETTTYTVTITTAEGCVIVDSVTIVVIYDALVNVASAFSPNGDGNNDLLHVIVRGIFHLDYFYIFNRWGELIFESHHADIGWNGEYKGEPQEVGTYVYVVSGLDGGGLPIKKHGNITLIR
jgi:gliding motility-associated-like protein